MRSFCKAVIVASLVSIWIAPVAGGENRDACFYLDKRKIHDGIISVVFSEFGNSGRARSIRLDEDGLYQGNALVCRWSLNGGSGTKERFSLDGDSAVPILDPECEIPFSHERTGVGFGDWYLTLCGTVSGKDLHVHRNGTEYIIGLKSLKQWTEFKPGRFPVEGDKGD